jgi:7-cyano-7-deazaguanine synthase
VILLSKAAVLCAQRNIGAIALGPLAGNPFPDATPAFFASMADALSLGLGRALEIRTPLVQMEKDAVIRLGLELGVPLALTLSCMNPSDGAHCGRCSKCRERRDAFRAAGVEDGTVYAVRPER